VFSGCHFDIAEDSDTWYVTPVDK